MTDSGYDKMMSVDLSTFWDNTQDLTASLASQLEVYSSLGAGEWSWSVEDPTVFGPFPVCRTAT